MADCFSAFVYGVNVRTCDLIAAGKAYAQVGPTLTAIHWIQRLRAKGRLRVKMSWQKAVSLVPVEVWGLVEQAVIDSAVEEARNKMLDELVCTGCDRQAARDRTDELVRQGVVEKTSEWLVDHFVLEAKWERVTRRAKKIWKANWIDGPSQEAHRSPEPNEWIQEYANTHLISASLTSLLATFDLYLPLKQVVQGPSDDNISNSTTTLATNTLRRSSGKKVKTTTQLECEADDYDNPVGACAILDVPKSVFRLETTVDGQFKRFLNQYHVGTLKTSRLVILSDEDDDGEGEREHKLARSSSTARWMLLTKLNYWTY